MDFGHCKVHLKLGTGRDTQHRLLVPHTSVIATHSTSHLASLELWQHWKVDGDDDA